MIESVSTGWVCAASLNPLNECSDSTQVKTTESAQRLARHEEPQKHGILMRLFIAIAEFLGFRTSMATVAKQATTSAPGVMSSLNEGMAKGLPEVMRSQASGITAKLEKLSLEQFMATYTEQLTGSNIMRNTSCLFANVAMLGQLVAELRVDTGINKLDISNGFSFIESQSPANIELMRNDRQAAGKVLEAVGFLAARFAEFPDPDQVGAAAVVTFVKDVETQFIERFAQRPAPPAASTIEEESGAAQAIERVAPTDVPTDGAIDPAEVLKEVKFGFGADGSLPKLDDFHAVMQSLQDPVGPLSRLFGHFESLAGEGSVPEQKIAAMVLKHTALGQTHTFGELFGHLKQEPAPLAGFRAIAMTDTLERRCSSAVRQLEALHVARGA
ncbi:MULTISPECIES: hypothetical protein [unclassified Pseudomonas]|uniref:hypothetical protein n=1 Tax=unclassified Pseudomonas TaxID=196821 RepID=UPI000C882471|nr:MULTISPECIES: hypothetical protein [unclassified Pseudomonas]PMZ90524.1 hypothetical protein C1X79_21700 [Pseudomonas sp. FW305-42]PNA21218.1 hypothetical protein C1X78_19935 [Pseudomonas sp. MPR-R1B]PNB26750.1 hypothetical protein C1X80_09935 [Pseudomonas sp. DP16D-E2]PNB43868.1 hypothetical protein C1X75_08500 [Pseudomonas sp. FW305-17]PNB57418.1 hypothetical protein C1X77_20970 [Pseudomonas sp. GW531-E2]